MKYSGKVKVSFYPTPEEHEEIKAAAEKENRSVANWLLTIIKNELKKEEKR
jgi:predicted HicB family RNase H-like nuclease